MDKWSSKERLDGVSHASIPKAFTGPKKALGLMEIQVESLKKQ